MTTAIVLVGALLAVGFLVVAITHWVHSINDRINTIADAALTVEADDWDEPTRAQIEWNAWVDEALRMSETPIHDQLARQRFEADALAEIDDMTGGIA